MNRPTFFISSTIYDFQDLRSALKFYLEEHGCKVLASEFNDFEKPLDRHSYEACLQAISTVDYFVLLIGTRVGGWYDKPNRISITQREYREAYRLQASGKLKLLNFVRSNVWHVKEDRIELAKFLESTDLEKESRATIANHPGKLASDADFLIKFINEVGRNEETKQAVLGLAAAPSSNWIHSFSDFRGIIDVLRGQLFSSVPIEDMTARRLLRRELRDFLARCLVKTNGKAHSPRIAIERFHAEHSIELDGSTDKYTTVTTKRWDLISIFAFHLLGRQLHPVVLPQILSKSTFLEFDLSSDSYRETPVYEALLRLQDEIRRFTFSNTTENLSVVFKHAPVQRSQGTERIEIETVQLAGLLHLLDRWLNIVDLSAGILRYLDGQAFEMPILRPVTPVHGMEQMLEDEKISEEDINSFTAGSN